MNETIDILKQRLTAAELPPAKRDALADDLEAAAVINGDPDPTRQLIKRLLISSVRREMMLADEIASAVGAALAEHRRACLAANSVNVEAAAGRFAATVRLLTPWRWPLAIAVFSPYAPDILSRAAQIFK